VCDRFLHVIFVSQTHSRVQASYGSGVISGRGMDARVEEEENSSSDEDETVTDAVDRQGRQQAGAGGPAAGPHLQQAGANGQQAADLDRAGGGDVEQQPGADQPDLDA
jgi:hypothetical protein